MTVALIIIAIITFILFITWLGNSRYTIMTLYHSKFLSRKKGGGTLRECYEYALLSISRNKPISDLSGEDLKAIVDVLSKFEDPSHTSVLLEQALKTKKIEYLREPYLSRLEEAGRNKNLII